jgi:hypothetical protein
LQLAERHSFTHTVHGFVHGGPVGLAEQERRGCEKVSPEREFEGDEEARKFGYGLTFRFCPEIKKLKKEEEREKKEDNSERRENEIGERRKVKVKLAKEINEAIFYFLILNRRKRSFTTAFKHLMIY